MYIINNKEKIKVKLLDNRMEKFKSFKFKLDYINEGLCFPKKHIISTYFFCQNVDIIFTDIDNNILLLKESVKSEKIVFGKKKNYYIYILKNGTISNLLNKEKLTVTYSNVEKLIINKRKKTPKV